MKNMTNEEKIFYARIERIKAKENLKKNSKVVGILQTLILGYKLKIKKIKGGNNDLKARLLLNFYNGELQQCSRDYEKILHVLLQEQKVIINLNKKIKELRNGNNSNL